QTQRAPPPSPVIGSEAKQSSAASEAHGLPRRFAPRNDGLTHTKKGRLPPGNRPSSFDPGSSSTNPIRLLQLDGAAGFLDALLELLGFGLGDALLDRLRGALDQGLGFAEAETGDRAHFLDHVDLLAAVAGEDDVELGLLFLGGSSGGAAAGGGRNRGRGRDAPTLFERLGEVGGFKDGQLAELVDEGIDVCHVKSPLVRWCTRTGRVPLSRLKRLLSPHRRRSLGPALRPAR